MKTFIFTLLTLVSAGQGDVSFGENSQNCVKSVTTVSGSHAPTVICSGDLIFEENFKKLDNAKWEHENTLSGGGNWEFQWYTNNRSNSYVKNGKLFIRPSLLSDQYGEDFLISGVLNVEGSQPFSRCTNPTWYGCERTGTSNNILNPIKSARLRTVHSFRFCYGKVEISAKMPAGDWLWPAMWLMPAFDSYGAWPSSGEIDLIEARGNRKLFMNGVNIGVEQVASALHYGPYSQVDAWEKTYFHENDPAGYHSTFKKYQLEWTPDYIKFSIDGKKFGEATPPAEGFWKYGEFGNISSKLENPWRFGSKMAPFDEEFYIILNLAVGGTRFFHDNISNPDDKPWNNNSPIAMKTFYDHRSRWLATWGLDKNDGEDASLQVDYVKVWAL